MIEKISDSGLPVVILEQTDLPDYRFMGQSFKRSPVINDYEIPETPHFCVMFRKLDNTLVFWVKSGETKKAYHFNSESEAKDFIEGMRDSGAVPASILKPIILNLKKILMDHD